MIERAANERIAGIRGHRIRRKNLRDLHISALIGEPIAAEKESSPVDRIYRPSVDFDSLLYPDGAGQHVSIGVHCCLSEGDVSVTQHLLHEAVILRQLSELALFKEIGAGVTHVDQGDPLPTSRRHQRHRDECGTHTAQLFISIGVIVDLPIYLLRTGEETP